MNTTIPNVHDHNGLSLSREEVEQRIALYDAEVEEYIQGQRRAAAEGRAEQAEACLAAAIRAAEARGRLELWFELGLIRAGADPLPHAISSSGRVLSCFDPDEDVPARVLLSSPAEHLRQVDMALQQIGVAIYQEIAETVSDANERGLLTERICRRLSSVAADLRAAMGVER